MSAPREPRDLDWLAAALDRACQESSRYLMAVRGRQELGLGAVEDLPAGLPVQERATAWALEYHVETVDEQGRRRVRLAPRHEYDDHTDPPVAREVPEEVAGAWRALLDRVRGAPARARLHHLLFERGGDGAPGHARAAARAYLESAQRWDRGLDRVQDLSAATRLARAVRDEGLVRESLDATADLVENQLAADEPPAGLVQRALRHLVGEPSPPQRVDDLLEQAADAWPDAGSRDAVLALMLHRAPDDSARSALWRRRVAVYTQEAEAATSRIMRAVRLQQALERAEASDDRELRQEAAALLQSVRHDDLEMLSFKASSRRYEEEFERLVYEASRGDDWRQALATFANFGPLSGDADRNREVIRERHREHPLSAYFPTQLLGPEGLPSYTGTTEQDRFDVDMVQWESQLIGQWAGVMAAALHEVPRRHGLPDLEEVIGFLDQLPAIQATGLASPIARSLVRYWTGDSEGAAYTIVPRIEALARALVVRADRGIYRLQREHVPGQYAGLGQLLPILREEYGLDESSVRFLSALLRHPAGHNLRNLMLHGYLGEPGPGYAAVLIHAALGLATVRLVPVADAEEAGDDG